MNINKIPMVRITWLDAKDTETGWLPIKDIIDAPLAVCQEVGYMVVNNDDKIVILFFLRLLKQQVACNF